MAKESERKLSAAEQSRIENYNKISEELESQGYVKNELTVDLVKANVYSFIIGLPFIAVFAFLYIRKFGLSALFPQGSDFLILFVAIIVLTVIHELIHGFFWGISCKDHFKNIKFGFIAEYLTPYCTCLVPITKAQYLIGSLAPGVILGFGISILSLFINAYAMFWIGAVMILGAGGDFIVTIKLLTDKSSKSTIYLDHPTKCGLIAYKKQ